MGDVERLAQEAFDKVRLQFERETDNATLPWAETSPDIREWWLDRTRKKRESDGATRS